MTYFPDFETFKKLAAGVQLVPVYRRLLGDTLTPVSAFHNIDSGPCACLFESVIGGEKVGRYSFKGLVGISAPSGSLWPDLLQSLGDSPEAMSA